MAKWIWVAIGWLQIPPGRLQLSLAQPFLPLNSWEFKDRLPPVRADLCQGEGLGEAQREGVQRLPQHEEAVLSDRVQLLDLGRLFKASKFLGVKDEIYVFHLCFCPPIWLVFTQYTEQKPIQYLLETIFEEEVNTFDLKRILLLSAPMRRVIDS